MKKEKKILVLGSDMLLGLAFDNEEKKYVYISSNCVSKLGERYDVSNFSRVGITARSSFLMLEKAFKYNHQYDICLIELGMFDVLQKDINQSFLEEFKLYLIQIINLLKSKNITVSLLTIDESHGKEVAEYLKKINNVIRDISSSYGLILLDFDKSIKKKKYNNSLKTDSQTFLTLIKKVI